MFLSFVTVACNVYVGLGPCELVYGAGLCCAIQGELIHSSVHEGSGEVAEPMVGDGRVKSP